MPDGPQDELRLEPHMIPALRTAFDNAISDLWPQLRSFAQNGYIAEPWLGDPSSKDVLAEYRGHFQGDPSAAYECLLAYRAELEKVRETLTGMETAYRRTEGDNAALWGRRA